MATEAESIEEARAFHQAGNLLEAERCYRAVLAIDPGDFEALHNLGLLEAQRGGYEQALELLTGALQANAQSVAARMSQANVLQALGRVEEALASCERALEIEPEFVVARYTRANLLLMLTRVEEALAEYDRVVALMPDNAAIWYNRGNVLQTLGRHAQALASYERALGLEPGDSEVLTNRGITLYEMKRYEEALASYDRALAARPDFAEALNNRANVLLDLKRPQEALASCDKALAVRADYVGALNNRGSALYELKRYAEALASCDQALALEPDFVEALNNRGSVLLELKRPVEAQKSCEQALAIKPDFAEAFYNLGNALQDRDKLDEAIVSYRRALALNPQHAEAHNNLGHALQEQDKVEEAIGNYRQALALDSKHVEAHNNLGNALQKLHRFDEAVASYDQALVLKPDFAEVLANRGNVLLKLGRHEEALISIERALALKPVYAEALNNRGDALRNLKRPAAALECYELALRIKPDFAEAVNNRGNALLELRRPEAALESYELALRIKPDFVEALNNRGNVLYDLKRPEAALESYRHALNIKPDYELLYGSWLHTKMQICDWTDLQNGISILIDKISSGEKASDPFTLLTVSSSPALQRKATEIFMRTKHPSSNALPKISRHSRRDKIRIGYFSADFRSHPVAFLTAGLFEAHDRSKFALTAFSFGPNTNDETRKRLEAAFENFIDVQTKTEKEVAMLARNLGIDIAVDLGGLTESSRTGIFSFRAAPLQVNYLGYPGTMGAEYIDYLVADRIIIPETDQQWYSEKIAYLPSSYQANDAKRGISDRLFTREDVGLPSRGFVFCCFNNSYKITPDVFDVWMRILGQVEESVLWLLEDNPAASNNLAREAVQRGIHAERLIFAKRMPTPEHLARQRLADLFLDTLPYNAHTTASDALWVGLPVLTCLGRTFAGKVAASLLRAIQLPELITSTYKEYEELAVKLASNPEKLGQIKQKLEKNRLTTALFDTRLFARHIEAAYSEMYEGHLRAQAPASFTIEPDCSVRNQIRY